MDNLIINVIDNEDAAKKYIKNILYRLINSEKLSDLADINSIFDKKIIQEFNSKNKSYNEDSHIWLLKLIEMIKYPLTIVCEPYYVDKVYRDSYYMYFSNKHTEQKRHCYRLTFFTGERSMDDFLHSDRHCILKDSFVGACVIRPLLRGAIGRTLISPKYILSGVSSTAYVRTATFNINVYGVSLSVKAFPYSMQDMETTTCAEIVLLNMLEYFSTKYSDYRKLLPSDIVNVLGKFSYERLLPTYGLNFPYLGRVLRESGFSPRIYYRKALKFSNLSIKKIWHYYIESGIPVALGLDKKGYEMGHAVIGIGHTDAKLSYKEATLTIVDNTCFIDSADLYTEYVIVDDNQLPYAVREYSQLSIRPEVTPSIVAVPLAKRMFMEATNAFSISVRLLTDDIFHIKEICETIDGFEELGTPNRPFVFRLFLASARSYKKNKVENISDGNLKLIYTRLPLPRFVWCCELYAAPSKENNNSKNTYESKKMIGELLLDATSADATRESLILIKFYDRIGMRMPDKRFEDLYDVYSKKRLNLKEDDYFISGYTGNLDSITN